MVLKFVGVLSFSAGGGRPSPCTEWTLERVCGDTHFCASCLLLHAADWIFPVGGGGRVWYICVCSIAIALRFTINRRPSLA